MSDFATVIFVTMVEMVNRIEDVIGRHAVRAMAQVRELVTRPKEPSVTEVVAVVAKIAFGVLACYHGMRWCAICLGPCPIPIRLCLLIVVTEFAFASGAVLEKIGRQMIGLSRND